MSSYCDVCQPQQIVASKKMLDLASDPSTTVWVCETHAFSYGLNEDYLIGDEETIERLWEEEEARRDVECEQSRKEANL